MKRKSKKGQKEGKTQISISLKVKTLEKLEKLAKIDGRNRSNYIENLIATLES